VVANSNTSKIAATAARLANFLSLRAIVRPPDREENVPGVYRGRVQLPYRPRGMVPDG
jgi:hypothetical protein